MATDAHTPCPACPMHVRALYAAAQVLVTRLADVVLESSEIYEAVELTRIAVQHLTPFVEAHLENQLHALSPELAGARNPVTATTLDLSRVLPFPEVPRHG